MRSGRDDDAGGATQPSGDTPVPPSSELDTRPMAGAAATAGGAGGPVPGQTWARYVVIEALGEGGMGAVWAAYDSELERKVALKVLHDELLGRASQERLRREARAMARVSHPNVVPVFDVGEHRGRSYYTMELVRGQSLKDWLREPRAWRVVTPVFVEAARGLAAIHATGLVHRDVKPGNLLLGDDGRARIADLGIAMSAPEAPVDVPLVATTTLRHAGTPAYMAPEQLRGAPGDAASDQFSFAVALWEALHGRPPFEGESTATRLAAMARGPIAVRDVPGWLDAAARRALALEPSARFNDVATLARVLEGPRARRWPIIAAAAVTAAAATAAVVAMTSSHDRAPAPAPPPTCATAGGALDEVWTPAQRDGFARALAAHRTAGDAAPDAVTGALDRAVAGWRDAARAACSRDAAGAWSPRLSARAAQCLNRQQTDVRAAILGHDADRIAVLRPAARCLDADYLAAEVEPPPNLAALQLAGGVRALLGVAMDLVDRGDVDGAQRVIDGLGTAPVHLDYEPLLAYRTDVAVAIAEAHGDSRSAAQLEEEEYYRARAAGDDGDALGATATIIELAAGPLADRDLAERWLKIARADAARRPDTDEAMHVLRAAAELEAMWGDADTAVADATRALALARASFGEHGPTYGMVVNTLAIALDAAGRHLEAVPYYERAWEEQRAWYGAGSPASLETVENLALSYADLGRLRQAEKVAREAVDIVERWPAAPPASAGYAHLNLGVVLIDDGRAADAIAPLERALALLRTAFGDRHRDVALAMTDLALAHEEATAPGDRAALTRIADEQRRAAQRTREVQGDAHVETLRAELNVAGTLRRLGRCAEATPIAARVLAAAGPDAAVAAQAQYVAGGCALDGGKAAAAIAPLRAAVAASGDDASVVRRALYRHDLALAQLRTGDHDGAIASERARRDDLATSHDDDDRIRAIDAWLAAPHDDPP